MRVESPISDMLWEGGPLPAAPCVRNSRFPEVGSRRAPISDPILRGVEELAMVTGREEALNRPQ